MPITIKTKMIKRELYLNQIIEYIDKPFIKVITGIRRSGKSVLLKLIQQELINKSINRNNIIYINFESFEFSDINEAKKLYSFIRNKIIKNKKYYLIFDEIQNVEGWEKAINSFTVDFNVDIFITGSNSHLLSSELATYLSGRYIQFTIYTLSFKEFLQFKKHYSDTKPQDNYSEFKNYLRYGGFPAIHTTNFTIEQTYKIVFDIYSSVILRDVIQRYKFRDIDLLERVVRYIFDNIGNKFSAKNISDYFKSQNRKLDINTIYNYINALESSYIIHRIPRYNIRGKEILKTNEKYFVSDQSLIYSIMGYRDSKISGILENIVMLELKRRGYNVFIGKIDNLEVDFIAEKKDKRIYIQVSYKITEQSTIDREYKPLLKIKDNFPKYILTMDDFWHDNSKGIKHMHIADFILNEI